MKDSWERVKLGELLKLQGGFAFASSMFQENGIPLIRISNISSSGIYRDFVYLPDEFEKFHSEFSLNENDILIAMSGATTGKNCKITSKHLPALLNQRTGRFQILNKEELDNDYLYYVVNSDNFQTNLLIDAIGGAQPNISSKQIENLSINLPPLPQQRKIAEILSTVDAVLEKTEAAIAKYQQLKQGLMHDVFTRGIDVHTGQLRPKQTQAPELYKQSPLGWIPKEWEVEELQNLTKLITDGAHHTPNYTESGVPFLRVTDVQSNNIDFDRIKYVSKDEHLELIKRCNPEKGDILYSKNGTIGIPKLVDWEWEFSIFVSLALIKPKNERISSQYLLQVLSEEVIWKQIKQRAKQGTVTNLHLEEIREFLIPLPNEHEQSLIFRKAQIINQKIRTEQQALAKYQQLKAGLLQDLLTGKVEVNV